MTSARRSDSFVERGWDPRGFVDYLAEGWQLGDPEAFIRHFRPIIHPEVVSEQPLSPRRTGIDALEEQFRQIFRLLPGTTATIRSWKAARPVILVEFELHAPARHWPLDLRTSDRFTLSGGLITHRSVHFDPTALLWFLARHPSRWSGVLAGF